MIHRQHPCYSDINTKVDLPMRTLKHPGLSGKSLTSVVPVLVGEVRFKLDPGMSFISALEQKLESFNASSAVAHIQGGCFDPFVYVMPALSTNPEYAVYFSDRHEPSGPVDH